MADKVLDKKNARTTEESQFMGPYGCSPLFDVCFDDALMSLSFGSGMDFINAIGWNPTKICTIKRGFIPWVRPEANIQGTRSIGYMADPCDDPNGIEMYSCDFTVTSFGRLRRPGPVRDITRTDLDYCKNSPRWRLDGTPVTDNREYDMIMATEVIMQDLKLMIIDGDAATAGQFSGLETLVDYNYENADGTPCELMNSYVVDWNDNDPDTSTGVTVNGVAITVTTTLIDMLQAVYRRIRRRIRNAPSLAAQNMMVGDMVLLLPSDAIPCILDAYTCWKVCPEGDITLSLEARTFRNSLLGGMYGAGRIYFDGFEIPLMPYDWNLISAHGSFDMYLLTLKVGNTRVLSGEYNDMRPTAQKRPDRYTSDNGLILTWSNDDETCETREVEMQPRLIAWAPWAEARFIDVACLGPLDILSDDPWSTYGAYP